jgi:hypothetical protein
MKDGLLPIAGEKSRLIVGVALRFMKIKNELFP